MSRLPLLSACALAALVTPLLACTPSAHLEPAENAPDPVCARMLQRLPRELVGLPRISTDAQATMAFGTPDAPVTIRCGLTPPPPTTDRCLSVSKTDEDAGVDWINPEAGSPLLPEHAPSDAWVFLTYGRTPALEVVIPVESGIAQPTAALLAVEPAATLVEAERTCVGATDLIGED